MFFSALHRYHATLRHVCIGAAMGVADVFPGVSGGTIAFVCGIYGRLVASVSAIGSRDTWSLLLRGAVFNWWRRIDGSFLFAVLLGDAAAILVLSHAVEYWLQAYPQELWSVFFGFILASCGVLLTHIRQWSGREVFCFTIAALLAFWFTGVQSLSHLQVWWMLPVSGAIAICAMMLPGISGSFVLVVLDQYERVITAISALDITTLLLFASGMIVGALAFAHLLRYLLQHYHQSTMAALIGLMLGSIRTLWPWKDSLQSTQLVWPDLTSHTLLLCSFMFLGAVIVAVLHVVHNHHQ